MGDVGACPDELQRLRQENGSLKKAHGEAMEELEMLRKKLSDLQLTASEGEADQATVPFEGDEDGPTSEALRKRLWRICKPRANGNPCHAGIILVTKNF